MSEPERLEEVGRWLSSAEEDLRTAEALLGQEDVPRQVCFHAQQASEKAIKSIFVFLQTEFPYTHDLDRLRELLPEDWSIRERFTDLSDFDLLGYAGPLPWKSTAGDRRGGNRRSPESTHGIRTHAGRPFAARVRARCTRSGRRERLTFSKKPSPWSTGALASPTCISAAVHGRGGLEGGSAPTKAPSRRRGTTGTVSGARQNARSYS